MYTIRPRMTCDTLLVNKCNICLLVSDLVQSLIAVVSSKGCEEVEGGSEGGILFVILLYALCSRLTLVSQQYQYD